GPVPANCRGHAGVSPVRTCAPVELAGKKAIRGHTPCFADPAGTRTAHGITATVYRVNQDSDQWHILFAWRHRGSLYSISEHVIRPYTYRQVVKNLDRLLAGLVLVRPEG